MRTRNAVTAMRLTAMRQLSPALALALVASACGSASASSSTSSASSSAATSAAVTSSAAASSTTTAAASAAAAPRPRPHLRILAPHTGARSGETLTVRVALTGAVSGGDAFRYVLDGRLTRRGSRRLTYHDLAPGHHHLLVSLVSNRSVHRSTVFTVPAPPPPPTPPPMMTTPAPTTMSPSPMSSIPQGDAGDHDADNNGAASDGDGDT